MPVLEHLNDVGTWLPGRVWLNLRCVAGRCRLFRWWISRTAG
jgi:hypothetical protein